MGRVNDPNYCHHHRIVSHPMEKCFILKDLIMKLAKQERIHLDLDEVVESNHVTVTFGSLNPVSLHVPPKTLGVCAGTIQWMVTSTHMVSCHEILEEDESGKDKENIFGVEPSKTKEDDEILKNSLLYATKITRAKRFKDKGHDCATCCANITYTNDDEKSVTSNFITIVFKSRHSSDAP
uniref:Uncharacterized protein n=1 Tax=Vitis vinifera TaxID=29760 RepID=A5BC84_VITVI|nr:hypothetical protein VITISV_011203 [Vitis vinifera]